MKIFLLFLLGGCLFPFLAFSQRVALSFNDMPCGISYSDSTFYVSIGDTEEDVIVGNIQLESSDFKDCSLSWNGKNIQNGDLLKIVNRKEKQLLTIRLLLQNGKLQNEHWKVVFTTLPVVCIDLEKDAVISKVDVAWGKVKILDKDGTTDGLTAFETPIRVHYRGATAATFEKKSFSLKLYDEHQEEMDVNILGIRPESHWILDAMAVDYSRMRNRVSFDIWNDFNILRDERMIRNGSKGKYVELIYQGQYFGLYCLSDKVNRKLLGLKKYKGTVDNLVYRGLLYKCRRGSTSTHFLLPPEKEIPLDKASWYDWDLEYPDDYPSPTAWNPLVRLTAYANTVFTDEEWTYLNRLEHFYDSNMTAYPVFALTTMLVDNMMHNTYLSIKDLTENEKFWVTPWDMDGSFGRDGTGVKLNWTSKPGYTIWKTQPFRTWIDDTDSPFFQQMARFWNTYKDTVLGVERVQSRIDAYVKLFQNSGAWEREREKWSGSPVELGETPEQEAEYMKKWYARNHDYLDDYFNMPVGISEIQTESKSVSGIYSLDGRLISSDIEKWNTLPQGLYIVNGQKKVR